MRLKPLVLVCGSRAGAELRQFHPGAARAERGRSYGGSTPCAFVLKDFK